MTCTWLKKREFKKEDEKRKGSDQHCKNNLEERSRSRTCATGCHAHIWFVVLSTFCASKLRSGNEQNVFPRVASV